VPSLSWLNDRTGLRQFPVRDPKITDEVDHETAETRERLYVGLSRARDRLVVCGDSAMIRAIGGEDVLRALRCGELPAAPSS
jgi:hypothetical protein